MFLFHNYFPFSLLSLFVQRHIYLQLYSNNNPESVGTNHEFGVEKLVGVSGNAPLPWTSKDQALLLCKTPLLKLLGRPQRFDNLVSCSRNKRQTFRLLVALSGEVCPELQPSCTFHVVGSPLSGKTILLRIFISATKYVRDLLFRGNPNSPQPDPTRWICFSSGMPVGMAIRGYRLHCSLGQMFPQLSPTRYWDFTNDRIIHSIGF